MLGFVLSIEVMNEYILFFLYFYEVGFVSRSRLYGVVVIELGLEFRFCVLIIW